jgi:D-amino-acid dehydrogenase
MAFLGQCNSTRTRLNTERKFRLCHYSQTQLQKVVKETGAFYEQQTKGLIYFYSSKSSFETAARKSELLKGFGLEIDALSTDRLIELDSGLSDAKEQIAGGLYCPNDESGDSRLFTQELARLCQEGGATFLMNTVAKRMLSTSDRITAIETPSGDIEADAFLVSLGVYSPELLAPLGIRLPIYPVKGYSVTLPVNTSHQPPKLGGVDEDHLLAYCPMGNHFRITATAEISGYKTSFKTKDFRTMLARARELLPNAADYNKPDYWACLRPMTPTGLPFIDQTRFSNLWLNTGHGHMGWTMACGSAKMIADVIAGRPTDIPRDGMTLKE